jgi:hypothetical protein
MLEARRSSTLFSRENWLSFWKEFLWSEIVLKWENPSIYEKYPLQMKWRNTCILWTILIRTAPCHLSAAWAAAGFIPCRTKPTVSYLLPPSFAHPRPFFGSWSPSCRTEPHCPLPPATSLCPTLPLAYVRPDPLRETAVPFFLLSQPACLLNFGHELPLVSLLCVQCAAFS